LGIVTSFPCRNNNGAAGKNTMAAATFPPVIAQYVRLRFPPRSPVVPPFHQRRVERSHYLHRADRHESHAPLRLPFSHGGYGRHLADLAHYFLSPAMGASPDCVHSASNPCPLQCLYAEPEFRPVPAPAPTVPVRKRRDSTRRPVCHFTVVQFPCLNHLVKTPIAGER
jgi:hypothetical protein